MVYRDDPRHGGGLYRRADSADRQAALSPELAGPQFTRRHPHRSESTLESLIRDEQVDRVVFAYSDVSQSSLMHTFAGPGGGGDLPHLAQLITAIECAAPVISILATRTGGQSPTSRFMADY